MNQILMIKNKKKKNSNGLINIKKIVKFFSFLIIIYGLALIGGSSYTFYKEKASKNPANLPSLTISIVDDQVVLNVKHSVEISKVIYFWNDKEQVILPEGDFTVEEKIPLSHHKGILSIIIEDMKGTQTKYQKEYKEYLDVAKPKINIERNRGNKKMIITAEDETGMKYLSYNWEGEQPIVKKAERGEKKIKKEVDIGLEPGTKTIYIIAEDINGNIKKEEQKVIVSTSEPKMLARQIGANLILEVSDEDGVKDIIIELNGKVFKSENINQKEVELPIEEKLQLGNNSIFVEVTNISGYTKKAAAEIQYNP